MKGYKLEEMIQWEPMEEDSSPDQSDMNRVVTDNGNYSSRQMNAMNLSYGHKVYTIIGFELYFCLLRVFIGLLI